MIAVGEAINGAVNLYASGIAQVDADYDERTGEVLRPITTGIQWGAEDEPSSEAEKTSTTLGAASVDDLRNGIKTQAALRAIREAFPDGIPAKTALLDKPFCKTVREKLPAAMALPPGKGGISDTTILRAAGRKR